MAVVDAKHLIVRLDDEKPEDVENEAQEQLAFADIVSLNTIDLVPEEKELKKIEGQQFASEFDRTARHRRIVFVLFI